MDHNVLIVLSLVVSFIIGFWGKVEMSSGFIFFAVCILAASSQPGMGSVAIGIIISFIASLGLRRFLKKRKS